jgi:hypothetical protein
MFDSFDTDAVHPKDGAVYGQLRQSTTVFNPSPATAPQGARPVLMIIADDMRPSLPIYGLKEGYAPNLGRLAETGTMWRHAYVQVREIPNYARPVTAKQAPLALYGCMLASLLLDVFGLQYSYCAPR